MNKVAYQIRTENQARTEVRELELGSTLESRIGNTPLIRLESPVRGLPGITLVAKAEWHNPGGSVKDRAAAAMIRDAIEQGRLTPGKTLLDATSGNTGIALAMLGAARGLPVLLTMPSNVSPERKRILNAYGAKVEWTKPDESSDGAIRRARELAGNDPERFCYLDQYANEANWQAHYDTTGPEIWHADQGPRHAFRCWVGNQRDIHGHVAQTEGAESRRCGREHAAGFALSRARRPEIPGDVDCACDLRSVFC